MYVMCPTCQDKDDVERLDHANTPEVPRLSPFSTREFGARKDNWSSTGEGPEARQG